MLKGMDLTFVDTLAISATGMVIVMIELALIALFVIILSKVMGRMDGDDGKKAALAAATPAPAPVQEDDGELAAVMSVVIEESGHAPEEIVFKSITRK